MELGDLRKWHIAIALTLFTGVLVWSFTQMEPQANPRTTSAMMFEQAVFARPIGKSNEPIVQDIRVYPPIDGINTVNFIQLVQDRAHDQWLKQEWSFKAKTPYVPFSFRPASDKASQETIVTWLNRIQAERPAVKYTYEWWREPGRLWMVWGAFSSILLAWGVVVPTVMWFAKGGAKEFKAAATDATPAPSGASAQVEVSDADRQKLASMIDRLEENTGDISIGSGAVATAAVGASAAGGSKVLAGKPLEALNVPDKADEKKDYQGVFYPVARSGGKKDH